ncbi:MAG: N-6 DNA methylase, partial [Spirochaetaceae bacterium]|nr:N-6 DNA methylase [Spirochaetaceae bacterium]
MPSDTRCDQLKSLVSLFSANISQYKSGQYDEANTRSDFIDKFFTLLDWDMANNQGFSESYRDVVREDKVKIDGSQKAPDYSFRIGGVRKFFVEAKKPSVNIKDAAEPAYQVRRYAYSAKLPISILTNFEEFAIYDTRIKPNKDDKASVARIFYCAYADYEQHFDFLSDTFSKEAILKGSFDKWVDENKNKKGTSEVDAELLGLIEEWRMELAKNIAKNNPNLSVYNLNTVVQKIIDRIIFLRFAEDKDIEEENLLLSVAKTANIYEKLILLFTKANAKYNSGLFAPRDWIDATRIDDKVLSNIIVNLYYPECPYEFSVLPIEILGSIYERFLGKTIRFRSVKGDTRTAVIEEKPEVKKAGGVFYTPQYIVDYIVKNTVGEKIKNKTPDEIAGIKICDPACGSGSFLVGAYQYLLNYHLDYYSQAKNVKSALKNAKIYETAFQSYKLTIEEKQRILTSAIFGVDIDSQAVEVTKLSLYLKLLENEGREAEGWLFKYSDKTLLPSLEDN